ncbi:anti-sigma factor C-terminal domain-containing protein [Paenibacillus sp. FSL R5-0810]|uniref:anti-sigma factor C-terminal domain-containing protein n=1 Tax=Paenibacillus sp. FSL R5-0810 TaxID=2921659 RepID=UPI0030F4C45E
MSDHKGADEEGQVLFVDEQGQSKPGKRIKDRRNRMIWPTRVKFLTNVLGAAILLLLLYSIYISAIHIYLDRSGRSEQFNRAVLSVIELHEDGLRVEKPAFPNIEVTPFLTQKTTLKLYRDVGKWQVITGEVHAKLSISGKLTYSVTRTSPYLNQDDRPAFILPYSVMFEETMEANPKTESDLKLLDQVGEGHVAQLSFSTKTLMPPEELLKLLADYDLAITGMPVYAGELKEFEVGYSLGDSKDYYVSHLSLKPRYGFREDNSLSMWQFYFKPEEDQHNMPEHVEHMKSDIEWMINNASYNGEDEDKQRLAYIQKNGVQVYGATVTGPVKELQRLKERPEFREFRLGRIEVWNWD